MNLRFAAIITGCMLVGAGAAAYHRVDGRSAAPAAELPPLFMQAATGAPTSASWPPSGSVAFYEEMFALLTPLRPGPTTQAVTTPVAARDGAPQTPPVRVANTGAGGEPTPQRPGVTPQQDNNDTVEIVIRDRFGRPIRVERVDRRRLAGSRGYPPPPGSYGSNPNAPYGPYGPYGPYRR